MHERFDELLDRLAKSTRPRIGHHTFGEVFARMALHTSGPITRTEISRGSSSTIRRSFQRPISQGMVSAAVRALVNFGVIEESPVKTASGRWQGALSFNPRILIAGSHVHQHEASPAGVTTTLFRLDGRNACGPAFQSVESWSALPSVILDQVAALQAEVDRGTMRDNHSHECPGEDGTAIGEIKASSTIQLFGIGIDAGMPQASGVPSAVPEQTVDLWTLIRNQLAKDARFANATPIIVENDTDAWAVHANQKSLCAHKDLVVVTVFDERISSGLIIDGRLRRRRQGQAMEIGHFQIDEGIGLRLPIERPIRGGTGFGTPCTCGGYGHLDTVAPPTRLQRQLEMELGIPNIMAASGDAAADIIRQAGRALGRAISHVCNTVKPTQLVVYVPHEFDAPSLRAGYLEPLRQEISAALSAPSADNLLIRELPSSPEELGSFGAEAAAACVLQAFIEHACRLDECGSPLDRR